jgi:hypothetical protein
MVISLLNSNEYIIIDDYDDYGMFYFRLSGNHESFWCRVLLHDTNNRVFHLIVDQVLTRIHPFVYGDLLILSDTAFAIEL